MEKISFVTLAVNPFWLDQTVMLAESLRAFGGKTSASAFNSFFAKGKAPLPQAVAEKLDALGAELVPISIEEQALKFPLGLLPFAAAETEKGQAGSSELLAWVLPDTLFISPPDKLTAASRYTVGLPPCASRKSAPNLILRRCVLVGGTRTLPGPQGSIFPMETCTRDKILRPYINAGILITRPENRFMSAWKDAFQCAYQNDNFLPLN